MTIFCTQRDSDWNEVIAAQFFLIAGALGAPLPLQGAFHE